jgi:hypothetical protein
MKLIERSHLHIPLRLAAFGQLIIAGLGPWVATLLNWHADMAKLPLLLREVFWVHTWFIALTCGIFAAITWRFARDIAAAVHPMMRWWSAAIALFWTIRVTMQWTYYSAEHWVGKGPETAVHWTLFFGYGAFAITYWLAALRK